MPDRVPDVHSRVALWLLSYLNPHFAAVVAVVAVVVVVLLLLLLLLFSSLLLLLFFLWRVRKNKLKAHHTAPYKCVSCLIHAVVL